MTIEPTNHSARTQPRLRSALFAALVLVSPASVQAGPADLDPTFGNGGVAEVSPSAYPKWNPGFVEQPDGKLVVHSFTPGPRVILERFLADGTPDSSFGYGGTVSTSTSLHSLVHSKLLVESTGRLMVFVQDLSAQTCYAHWFTPNGTLDSITNLSCDGRHPFVSLKADDSLFLGGMARGTLLSNSGNPMGVATLLPSGSTGRLNVVRDVPSGKWLVGVNVDNSGGSSEARVARLTATGALDTSFASSGMLDVGDHLEDMVVYPDGRFLTVSATETGSTLKRFLASGEIDTTSSASCG